MPCIANSTGPEAYILPYAAGNHLSTRQCVCYMHANQPHMLLLSQALVHPTMQIAVHLSTTGAPLGVTYAVASPACRSTGHEGLVQLPASTKVSVTRALLAPSLAVQDAGLGGPGGRGWECQGG